VLNHLKFQLAKFKSGYYGVMKETDGEATRYCFEPSPLMTIKEAADKVTSYRKTTEISAYTKPTDENLPILGFTIRVFNDNNKVKGYDFGINEAHEYTPGNRVKLNDVMFTYYSEASHWGFLAKGKLLKFAPTVFEAIVFRNGTFLDDVSSMSAHAPSMNLRSLVNSLKIPDSVNSLAGAAIKAIKNLGIWDTTFSPVEVHYDFRIFYSSAYKFVMTKKFGGIPLHFETVFIDSIMNAHVAFGFTFDGESFGAMMDKMSSLGSVGNAVSKFLNGIGLQIEVGLVWCPEHFGGSFVIDSRKQFIKQPLRDAFSLEIPGGLSAVAQVSIPKDCKGSQFCETLKQIVGASAAFRIVGNVNSKGYMVNAGFYNIKIYKDYVFSALLLYAQVNTSGSVPETELGFRAEVQIPINVGQIIVDGIEAKRYLVLGGAISHKIGTPDTTGVLYMRGRWYQAFGLKWLNLANIRLSVTFTVGSPIPTAFSFGATLDFGFNCLYDADFGLDGHCLRVAIYFGVGKLTYFFGQISALTIGKLLRIARSDASLPECVAKSGFPKGLYVNYATDAADLRPEGGPYIVKGFRLAGTLDLLGYQITANIIYSETEIRVAGELDPINLGSDLIVMARSASQKHLGPKFDFHWKKAASGSYLAIPYINIYFEGYLKVLGIEASAYLNITMTQLEIFVYGKVWNLIYCELYIEASYDFSKLQDSNFYIRVVVDLSGITKAIEDARKSVDRAFKAAQAKIRGAIAKVKKAKADCKEKLKLKCSNCYSLKCKQAEKNCKGFLDAAGKWIAGAVKKSWKVGCKCG